MSHSSSTTPHGHSSIDPTMAPASSLHLPPSPTSPTHSHHGRDGGRPFAYDLATPSSLLYRPTTSPSPTTRTSIMDQLLLAARPLPPLPMSTQGPPVIDMPETLCLDDLVAIASSHSGGGDDHDDDDDDEPYSPATPTFSSSASSVTLGGGGGADMSIQLPDVATTDERDSPNANEDHVEALAYALHELACGEADFAHLLVALAEEGVPEFLNSPIPTSAQLPDDPMADSADSRVYVRHLPDLAALHLTLSGSLSDHDVAHFLPANDKRTSANASSPLPTGSVEHAAQAMALAFLDALSAPNAVSLYTTACAPLSHALAQWRLRVPNAPALVSAYQAATAAPCNVCGKLADAAAAAVTAPGESRPPSHIPDLDSLLASVMQRITRYPLLWSSIRKSLARVVGSEIAAHAPVPALMAVEMAEVRAREVAQAVDEAKQEYDRRVRAFAFWMNAVPKPMVPAPTAKPATIKRCCSTADESLAECVSGEGHGCAAGAALPASATPAPTSAVLETGALDASVADHADGLLEVSMLMSASARVSVRNWWQGDHSAAGAGHSPTSRGNPVRTSSAASIAESVEDGPLSLVLASGLSMEALVLGPPPNPPESTPASLASAYPDIPMDSVGRTLTLSRRSTRGVNRRQSSCSTQSMCVTPTGGMSAPASEQGSLRRPQSTPPTSQLPTPPSSSSSADTYVDMQPALPPLPSAIPPELSSCYWNTINSNRASSVADSGIAIPVMPPMPPEPQYLGFFLFSDGTLVAASPVSPPSSTKNSSSSSSLSLKRQSMMVPADEPTAADSQSPKYHIRYVWRLREDGWGVQELLGSDGVDRFGLRLTGPLATVDFYARSPRVRTSWLAALYSVLCPGQIATPFPSWASVASTATPSATPLGSPKMTPSASFSTIHKHQHQHQQQHPGSPSIGAVTCMSLPPLDLPPLADDAMVLPTFVEVPLALPGMPLPTLGRPNTAGTTNSDDSGIARTASVRKSKRTSRVWQGLTRAVSRRTKSTSPTNSTVTVAAELDRAFADLFTYIPAGSGPSQTGRAANIARSSSAGDVTKNQHALPRPLSRAAKSTVDVPSQMARHHRERRASSSMDLQALVAAVMAAASRPATPAVHPSQGRQVSSDALSTMAVISRDRQVMSPKQVCVQVGPLAAESEDEDDDDALFVCPPSRVSTPAIGSNPAPPVVQVRPPSPLTIPARFESLKRSSTMGRQRSRSSPTPPPAAGSSRSCVSVIISNPHPRSSSLLSAHTESLLGPPSDSDIGEPLPLGPTPSPPAVDEPVYASHFLYAPPPVPLKTSMSSTALASSLGLGGDISPHYSAAMHSLTNGGSGRGRSASMSSATGRHVVTSTMDDLGFEPVTVRTIAEEESGEPHQRHGSGSLARQHKWGKGWVAKWSRRVSGIGSASFSKK